jgi:hypothetical protein
VKAATVFSGIALFAVPITLCYALGLGELALRDRSAHIAVADFPEVTKKIVDIQVDLSKLFIGFSTTVIGALGYYLKSRTTEFRSFSPLAVFTLCLAFVSCIASVYFGQIWIASIITELDGQYFSPSNAEVAIPQAAQYFSFLAALMWSTATVVLQELQRGEANKVSKIAANAPSIEPAAR